MLDTEASSQSRKVCSVFIDWLAHVDHIGTGRLLQIQSLFIPHEDLLELQQKKETAGETCGVPTQIKPLYCYHEKHVTLDELRK